MKHKLALATAILLALALLLPPVASAAGGSSSSTPSTSMPPQDPRAMARDSYKRAIKYREKAAELEAKAAAAGSETEREKLEKKARKEYERAIRTLSSAVENDPGLYEAHSDLGYALRKTGQYGESLAAYNRALELNPSYAPAIEYRGEAFLGLNRLQEAKEAYMELFRLDREQADALMSAMRSWVDRHEAAPEGVDAETFEAFSSWVSERLDVVSQVGAGSSSGASW